MLSVSVKDLDLKYLDIHVLKKLNLDIKEGEFLVLLGSSGCGKSTLLNCIAGLLDISAGQIWINGRNVTWEEPKDRGIGMVFQSYALYPQMSVEKNLSFGLRVAGIAKKQISERVQRTAEILQIEPLLKRKPAELSGGQRQRVAIGRALVRDVDVFLFDEPLSNLDAKLRADLRIEIKRLHQKLKNTMIYVTHDQVEALTLADRIAIMKNGMIQQLSTPHEIYHKPVNLFVAGFIGSPTMNFVPGVLEGANLNVNGRDIDISRYSFLEPEGKSRAVTFGIRPENIVIGEAAESMPVKLTTRVDIVEPMGSESVVWTEIFGKPFSIKTQFEDELFETEEIQIGFDPIKAHCFDKQSEMRI